MTIEEIFDELETLLMESSHVPFTNKRIVEEDELVRLLDYLRELIPQEVMEARKVLAERTQIVENAQREAQRVVEQAKVYGAKMTDDNIIAKQAQEQAQQIMQQAQEQARDLNRQSQEQARQLQQDSTTYADEVFRHLSGNLEKALEVVRQGHAELHRSLRDKHE